MYFGHLHSAFNATSLFTHRYYLPLPQSYQMIGSSTPERGVEDFQDSKTTEAVKDTYEPGARGFLSPEHTGRKPVTEKADNNKGNTTCKGEDSNGSWDLDTMLKDDPKMDTMMYGY